MEDERIAADRAGEIPEPTPVSCAPSQSPIYDALVRAWRSQRRAVPNPRKPTGRSLLVLPRALPCGVLELRSLELPSED
ncbi:hypothetical protein ABZ208_19270 [Streptomyces sp. NPDC006208]|uniref:hypothetical protein n=1 Tax=Streptomyces sp. NPDC006208 TaxID=3156734 RepID=UPI0033B830A0